MTKTKKIWAVVVAIIVIILVGAYMGHRNYAVGAAGSGVPSGFDNVNLTGALMVGVNPGNPNVFSPYGAGSIFASSSIVSSSTLYTAGGMTSGGLCTLAPASTTASVQLTVANMACSVLSVTSGTTTATLSLILPASSTMSNILYPGDASDLYIYAASTTAGNIIIAGTTTAGFSINSPIGIASTTAASSTINAGEVGILDYIKLPTTDVYGIITPSK